MDEIVAQTARADRSFWRLSFAGAAIQIAVISLLISNSYFIAEDLYLPGFFADLPWSWETLSRSIFGHLMPGFVAVWKSVASIGSLSWPLVSIIIGAVHLLLFIGTIRLLTALHGRRWWVPVMSLVASLSLALLSCVLWWGAALAPGIGAVAAVWVWDSTIRFLRERSWYRLAAVLVTMTVAMCFGERQILTPVYVLSFVVIVGTSGSETLRERVRSALRGWLAWAAMAAVGATFLALYFSGSYRSESGSPAPTRELLTYLGRSIAEGFLPSILGVLPGATWPAAGWAAVATVVAGAIVTSWRSAHTRRAWLWFLGAYVVCQFPIAIGRVGIIGVDATVDMVRYYPEATLLFWIAASVAIAGLPAPQSATSRRAGVVALCTVCVCAVAAWSWSAVTMSSTSPGAASNRYFSELSNPDSALASALDAGGLTMLDVPLPPRVIQAEMYPWNSARRIYPWVHPGTPITSVVEGSTMLGLDGSPVAVEFSEVHGVTSFVAAGCIADGDAPIPVLTGVLSSNELGAMVRLRITAQTPSEVRVLSTRPNGEAWPLTNVPDDAPVQVPAGSSTIVVPVAPVDADGVTVRVEGGGPICVTDADLVRPVYR